MIKRQKVEYIKNVTENPKLLVSCLHHILHILAFVRFFGFDSMQIQPNSHQFKRKVSVEFAHFVAKVLSKFLATDELLYRTFQGTFHKFKNKL